MFLPKTAHAAYQFEITDYDLRAIVSEKNVYDITETISVRFIDAGMHGIYRTIPVNSVFERRASDGTVTEVKVPSSVWDVQVEGDPFHQEYENGYKNDTVTLYFGDANKTVSGTHTYKVHYKLGFGDDQTKDFDEAYFNVLGTNWDVQIDRFSFMVTLPKAFDAKKLGFSMGARGDTGYDPAVLKFNVYGNTISGEVASKIHAYTGITMRAELPDGYFDVPDIRIPDWILMGVIGAVTLLALLFFLLYGRDKKPVVTVEFDAPNGMTPPELAYVYAGSLRGSDAIALLIYWADKGYMHINKEDGAYQFVKRREMGSEAQEFERHMFRRLFYRGPSVYVDELQYIFYTTIQSVNAMIKSKYEKEENRAFTKKSQEIGHWINFFMVLPFITCLVFALSRTEMGWGFAVPMGIMFGGMALLPFFWFRSVLRGWQAANPKYKAARLIVSLLLTAGVFAGFLAGTLDGAHEPLLPVTAIIATFILGFCSAFASKRTQKGNEWLGKILGFKNFIQKAEEDRLKMLVEENPNYFYHILPYAYVLNITDQWVKNFETLALEPPGWYSGYSQAFTTASFMQTMNSAMSSFNTTMTSSPASSSSGSGGSGSSGGSSSGGGGGGGGGGGW
jgi:uncharacterized membrane protein YgcG